jgi:hypothetical protein
LEVFKDGAGFDTRSYPPIIAHKNCRANDHFKHLFLAVHSMCSLSPMWRLVCAAKREEGQPSFLHFDLRRSQRVAEPRPQGEGGGWREGGSLLTFFHQRSAKTAQRKPEAQQMLPRRGPRRPKKPGTTSGVTAEELSRSAGARLPLRTPGASQAAGGEQRKRRGGREGFCGEGI